jgi:hypothetical protein
MPVDMRAFHLLVMRSRQTAQMVEDEAKEIVQENNEGLCVDIKSAMPVDSGRAKAGWGKYTPGDLTRHDPKNPSSEGDAVWIVSPKGWSIRQGTNVPYTVYLNEGHSQQAPAGFIDARFAIWRERMLQRVSRLRALHEAFGEG